MFASQGDKKNWATFWLLILLYTGVGNSLVASFSFVKGRVPEKKNLESIFLEIHTQNGKGGERDNIGVSLIVNL